MSIDFSTEFIGLPSFAIIGWESPKQDHWIAHLQPHPTSHLCPVCGKESVNHARPGRRTLMHRFVPSWGRVLVTVPIYRQRCDICILTWTVEWEGIPSRGKATHAFQEMCVEMCRSRDIQSVSKYVGVTYTTLERWYYQSAPQKLPHPVEEKTPEIVCLDEFALQKGHKYGLNLMDAINGHVWQITKGKSRQDIQNALTMWPFASPKVVVTDLAPGMADTVKQVWSHTEIVADKFHVIQLFSKYLEMARKRSQYRGTHRKGRHEQRLLHTQPHNLKDEERMELTQWLQQDINLKRLYEALQDMREFYQSDSIETGRTAFEGWMDKHQYSATSAVRSIAKTLIQWKNEILNYFVYRVTNARIEGTHNKIKVLKRRAYGYRNIDRFAIRIRLECRPA